MFNAASRVSMSFVQGVRPEPQLSMSCGGGAMRLARKYHAANKGQAARVTNTNWALSNRTNTIPVCRRQMSTAIAMHRTNVATHRCHGELLNTRKSQKTLRLIMVNTLTNVPP